MEKICHVTNRSSGIVCYQLPDRHISRDLYPNKTQEIEVQELKELLNRPGGKSLLQDYCFIEETDVVNYLFGNEELQPEYYLTVDNIGEWMTKCSLDEFRDALDFAPNGVLELIKQFAVSLPLNDLNKCKAIQEQLKFDVFSAIRNERDTKEDEPAAAAMIGKRRAVSSITTKQPTRRVIGIEGDKEV